MTKPRPILEKNVSHYVRRTDRREYRLKPCDELDSVYGYLLGTYLDHYNMTLHAMVGMPTHYHLSVSDHDANGSLFRQTFNGQLTRAMNTCQNKPHTSLFERRQSGVTVALDPESAWDDMLYICMNPMRAGLSDSAESYVGFMIGPWHWGEELTFERPDFFFSEKRAASVSFTPMPPPQYNGLTLEEAREKALADLNRQEDDLRAFFDEHGLSTKSDDEVLNLSIDDSPDSPTGFGEIRPRYKAHNPETREAALNWEDGFQFTFFHRRKRLRNGHRDVCFPEGTDLYRRRKIVAVERRRRARSWYPFRVEV